MIILHIADWSPQALSIAIALEEKGLEYQVGQHQWQNIPSALQAFAGPLEQINTLEGEFPILVDGDSALSDSYFVLEYLDDAYPSPPLRPADAFGQWKLQALARFMGERALPSVCTLGVAKRFTSAANNSNVAADFANAALLTSERRGVWEAALTDPGKAEDVAESQRKAGLFLDRIEQELEGSKGPYILGTRFTLTDISAFVLALGLTNGDLGFNGTAGERTRAWLAHVGSRESVQAVLAMGDPAYLPGPEHARWG